MLPKADVTCKLVFQQDEFLTIHGMKTGIKQSDWLAVKFIFLLTNLVAIFFGLLRVAQASLPSRKLQYDMANTHVKNIKPSKFLAELGVSTK